VKCYHCTLQALLSRETENKMREYSPDGAMICHTDCNTEGYATRTNIVGRVIDQPRFLSFHRFDRWCSNVGLIFVYFLPRYGVGVGVSHLKEIPTPCFVSSGLLCNFVAVYLTFMQFILELKLCLCTIIHLLLEELTKFLSSHPLILK